MNAHTLTAMIVDVRRTARGIQVSDADCRSFLAPLDDPRFGPLVADDEPRGGMYPIHSAQMDCGEFFDAVDLHQARIAASVARQDAEQKWLEEEEEDR